MCNIHDIIPASIPTRFQQTNMIRNRLHEPENIPQSHDRKLQQPSGPRPTTRLLPKRASTTQHQTRPAHQIRPHNAPAHRNRLPRSITRPDRHTARQTSTPTSTSTNHIHKTIQNKQSIPTWSGGTQVQPLTPPSPVRTTVETLFFQTTRTNPTNTSTTQRQSALFFHHLFPLLSDSLLEQSQDSRVPQSSGVLNRYRFHAARCHRQHYKQAPQPFT